MANKLGNTLGVDAAKANFSELLEKITQGQEFTITKHGIPIAKLVPVKRKSTSDERRAAIESMREAAKGLSLRGLKIRDLINEGRR